MTKHVVLTVLSLLAFTSSLFSQGSYLDVMGIIRGDSLGAQFGKKVVPAGDVNGDTIPDFLVGAFDPSLICCPPPGAQKVYLFYGKKGGLDTVPDLVFEHKKDLFWVGDLNGDGGWDFGMRESGQNLQMSVYFGGNGLDTIWDGFVKGESSGIFLGDAFGLCFSVGKLSNMGDKQIVVGATAKGYDSTRFYFFNIVQDTVDSLPFKTFDLGDREGSPAGPAEIVGDINGDGFADLGIGRTTRTDIEVGEVEVYLGGPSFDSIPDITLRPPLYITGITAGNFGSNLAAVGDLNNDGFSEFVIGAGRTPLLYFGGNPVDTLPRFRLAQLGDVFVNGGDINHDGYLDLLVGRPESPITGFAYVYYGGPAMDSVVDLQIKEIDLPTPAEGFGQTVAGLGDIDGDGSNDFAVGSTSNTNPDRGYLWVFNGILPNTGVDDGRQNIPRNFKLEQNYPNPFNSTTVISYNLTQRGIVRLEIFNIVGQRIRVLMDRSQSAGKYQLSWDGKDFLGKTVPNGIYIYRLQSDDESETKKLMLIK